MAGEQGGRQRALSPGGKGWRCDTSGAACPGGVRAGDMGTSALRGMASGGHSFPKGRMPSRPNGSGRGLWPLPPLPSRGGCSPSNSRTSPWLRDAGWGHGGGILRAGTPVPHCPAVEDAALPQAELTALAEPMPPALHPSL